MQSKHFPTSDVENDLLTKFNLLLLNPKVLEYTIKIPFINNRINELLGYNLKLPVKNDYPFLFSCFVLSLDGKLCYPDSPSGFTIAKSNHHASIMEKNADWFTLILARSISDAVIVGSNSLKLENGRYLPIINIPSLLSVRQSKPLWTIIICRNFNNLDLTERIFVDNDYPLLICCLDANIPTNTNFCIFQSSKLNSRNQLKIKNILIYKPEIDNLYLKLKELEFNIILNESPYIHHDLLEKKLLDEIWLNYSFSYIGGNLTSLGQKQKAFSSTNHPDCEILTLHNINYHFLYSRQKVLYP